MLRNSSSVHCIMDDLEKKMATLTPAFVESVRRRTKMLSQELDSVSKKMKRHGGSLSGQTDQEKEKIIKLYDTMVKYDHVSEEIPVIVERLKSVEGLHRQSLDFDRKLKQLEEAQLSCLEYLKRDENFDKLGAIHGRRILLSWKKTSTCSTRNLKGCKIN